MAAGFAGLPAAHLDGDIALLRRTSHRLAPGPKAGRDIGAGPLDARLLQR
jgi:hypothetical protein